MQTDNYKVDGPLKWLVVVQGLGKPFRARLLIREKRDVGQSSNVYTQLGWEKRTKVYLLERRDSKLVCFNMGVKPSPLQTTWLRYLPQLCLWNGELIPAGLEKIKNGDVVTCVYSASCWRHDALAESSLA